MKENIIYFAFIFLLAACTSSDTVQNGSYKYLYDYESRELHPEYVIYHHTDDSSTVFFRVRSSELLYARNGSSAPFTARLQLKTTMTEANGMVGDTTLVNITDASKSSQGWLLGSYRVRMPAGFWNVLVEFGDETKGLIQPSYLRADKTSIYTSQNYLVRKKEINEPLFGGFVPVGSSVIVESNRNRQVNPPKVLRFSGEPKLPPPPFSSTGPEMPDMSKATEELLSSDSSGVWNFEVQNGSYFITQDAFHKSGITIKTANLFYPEVKAIESLQWPLRYITSKTEHEEIVKNSYPKMMIDKFWLECAGNKDHARELIRIFYHRVEEANYYFSTYTEGWRTDRGMIHLVFGNPTKVTRFNDSETWQYGEDGSAGLLSFVFRKAESPLSGNVYVLDRDPGFKTYWEKGVQTWRNGRVYSD